MQKEYGEYSPEVSKIQNGKNMLSPRCAVCDNETSKLIKNEEGSGLLSLLGIRAPLSKITILGDILF